MKRWLCSFVIASAGIAGAASSAEAGLFFHRRVVYRQIVVSPVVSPVYVAPQPVVYGPAPFVYTPPRVVYSPGYYAPAPAYYAPAAPVYVGW
jgi:hypothetical protein